MISIRKIGWNRILTTPIASSAKSTVPKKNGNSARFPYACLPVVVTGSLNIQQQMMPNDRIVITFATLENGAKYFKFRTYKRRELSFFLIYEF